MKLWLTARELADLALPGLPSSKRNINRLADEEGWRARQTARGEPLARRRAGKTGGGGWEYHVTLIQNRLQAQPIIIREVGLDAHAPVICIDAEDMAVFQRAAKAKGVPVGVILKAALERVARLFEVAS